MNKAFKRIFHPSFLRRLFPSKQVRAYRKMHRRHRRELVKLAKEVREWDYGWLDELVRTKVRHMYEYFSEGNNVWQTDDTRLPIVEQLRHVLDLYDELDNLWDGIPNDIVDIYSREDELYEEIYSYIGCHIREWWD